MKKFPSHGILEVTDMERRFRSDPKNVLKEISKKLGERIESAQNSPQDNRGLRRIDLLHLANQRVIALSKALKAPVSIKKH
jgi:hypothetical protein